MVDIPVRECQFIGPDQDPLVDYPIKYCCKPVFPGRAYCEDHVWRVYQKGTSTGNKRKLKEIEKELEELKHQQEIAELENM